MSGHSKWHQIKHKKAVTDSRKSQLFGRLAQEISRASRAGQEPATNPLLREVIARAKKFNFPQDNIERILASPQEAVTDVIYEGYGPGGGAFLVTSTTDNPNRTVAELRAIFKDYGGSLGTPGSVRWKFVAERRTRVTEPLPADREALILQLIEAGASDVQEEATALIVRAPLAERPAIDQLLGPLSHTSITEYMVAPENQTRLPEEQQALSAQLQHALLDHPDVLAVFTDLAPTAT